MPGEDCYPDGDDPDAVGFAATQLSPRTDDDDAWIFAMFDRPADLTVRAYDVAGTVIAEAAVEPRWKRIGGSEECGGPHHADVEVTL
ncbi:hypothetical protein [Litorihabitans aurantiacus]|uniref:Uncharacterized protein n=1 Tax=Litorihabitans aurantiacus TaxID=1930061 RepID=A0AA38CUU7_9MICO|nr:hypothetical protein [Litorihabitans aurantiacus]GMA32365.1 hypothetical protein GCM10025875_23570 [Litorihabitans aurantiacus]